jgi:hypothetical protein
MQSASAKYRGVSTFSAADLSRLKDGEAWAHNKAMPLEEFREQTDRHCD